MAVDKVTFGSQVGTRLRLDHPDVVEALQQGDIHKIKQALPSGVTIQDIEEFLKHRFAVLDQTILQNQLIKADAVTVPPPSLQDLAPTHEENMLSEGERALLRSTFGTAKGAMVAKAAEAAAGGEGAEAQADVEHAVEQTVGVISEHAEEYEQFALDLENQIFNMQLTMELEAKRGELKKELQRIIEMMKSGAVDPAFVLVALAKVQISERGILFSQMGRRVMHINEQQMRVTESIGGLGSDIGGLEMAKQEQREYTMGMQQATSLMQRLVQDIDAIMGASKSMLENYTQTENQLIANIGSVRSA